MNEQQLRAKLPIGQNEKILLVTKHHWFAYLSVTLGAGGICAILFGALVLTATNRQSIGLNASAMSAVAAGGLFLIAVIALASLIPVWLKQQEYIVLTEEALLQVNKPTLFASKISQLNLQHVADVTVKSDMMGSMLGYGHIAVETPGEQDNYEFNIVAEPNKVAKAIVEAHENYAAALESGQIQTTLGQRPPVPGAAWRPEPPTPPQSQQPSNESMPPQSPQQPPVVIGQHEELPTPEQPSQPGS
ncbi:hypothetical protein KC957_00345 [Candidatus Saccharibacteria bacterium]|nr:hypothetical protein [Candidatus Saccharibacteria bacterium]